MKAITVTFSTGNWFNCFSSPTSPGLECRSMLLPHINTWGVPPPIKPPSLAVATMLPQSLSSCSVFCRGLTSENQGENAVGSYFSGSLRTTQGSVFLVLSSNLTCFRFLIWRSSHPCEEPGQSLLIKIEFNWSQQPQHRAYCKVLGAKTVSPQWPDAQFHSQNHCRILKKV